MNSDTILIRDKMAALVQDVLDGLEDPAKARQWIATQLVLYPSLSDFAKMCIEQIEGA